MRIVTVGMDLAKKVFAVHGVDETGKPALVRLEVPRAKLLELVANLPPSLIGVEPPAVVRSSCRQEVDVETEIEIENARTCRDHRVMGSR